MACTVQYQVHLRTTGLLRSHTCCRLYPFILTDHLLCECTKYTENPKLVTCISLCLLKCLLFCRGCRAMYMDRAQLKGLLSYCSSKVPWLLWDPHSKQPSSEG